MPEGDTVWNTARVLERALVGDVLTGSDFRVPQLATIDLTGFMVASSGSRGKHLLLRVERGDERLTLHSHLRMDGAWRAYRPGERWTGRPAHLIRVVLRARRSVAVGYHLHEVALIRTATEESYLSHLGPDLLGADWDPEEAVHRIAGKPDVTISEALLDQRNLAGVGNLYKAETLFLSGVWPWTPVRDVQNLDRMVRLAQKLVASNKGRWTQTTTGSLHRGQTSYVYGRRAQPCRRCGAPIRRADLDERVTYWCPHCQPEPTAPPDPGQAPTPNPDPDTEQAPPRTPTERRAAPAPSGSPRTHPSVRRATATPAA